MADQGPTIEVPDGYPEVKVWDPEDIRELMILYNVADEEGSNGEQVHNLLYQQLVSSGFLEGYSQAPSGTPLLFNLEEVPMPIYLGDNLDTVLANIYGWLRVPLMLADPELPFESYEGEIDDFVGNMTDTIEEATPTIEEATPEEMVQDITNLPEDQLDIIAQPNTQAVLRPTGGAKLRNGVLFKPPRVFYGE